MRNILLDTGALVALLDKSERNHSRCVEFFRNARCQFLTTEAVLTESLYLLSSAFRYQKACLDFIIGGGVILVPASTDSIARSLFLMERYQDTPMDFADATLVVLGEEIDTNEIFTLDRKGFLVYRLKGRKTFRVYPE